jgi:hypothetical protein
MSLLNSETLVTMGVNTLSITVLPSTNKVYEILYKLGRATACE